MIIDPRLTARLDVTPEDLAANRPTYERDLITQLRDATALLGAETDTLVAACGLAQVPADESGRTPFIAQWTGRDAADIIGGPHDGQTVAVTPDATTLSLDTNPGGGAFGGGGTASYQRAGINDATGNWAFIPA